MSELLKLLADPDQVIRGLSWKAPFARMMLPPFNKVETRSWPTKIRGLVLICESKKGYSNLEALRIMGPENNSRVFGVENKYNVSREDLFHGNSGYAIGIGILTSCCPAIELDPQEIYDWDMRKKHFEEKTFCIFHHDLFALSFSEVTPIVPFKFSGAHKWKTVTEQERKQILLVT